MRDKKLGRILLPKIIVQAIVLDAFKSLSLNARILGNFQCALAAKGKTEYNWEEVIRRTIQYSAVEIMWGKE